MKKGRNQTLDWIKLFASFFVVWMHIHFPESLHTIVLSVAVSAVPVFFATSGYFGLHADCDTIKRRFLRILKITVSVCCLFLVWTVWRLCIIGGKDVLSYLQQICTGDTLVRLLLGTSFDPAPTLWFMTSLLFCYLTQWGYVCFFGKDKVNYGPLYIAAFLLTIGRISSTTFASISGIGVYYAAHRNFIFFGLPMFTLGLFLREHGERILINFRWNWKKSLAMFVLGVGLSLLELFQIGYADVTIGALFSVIALLLFAIQYPELPAVGKLLAPITPWVSQLSLVIYIVHTMVNHAFGIFQNYIPFCKWILGRPYRYPVVVLLVSIGIGILCCCVTALWRKWKTGTVSRNH